MSGARLASGGLVDRGRRLEFRFEGRRYSGYAGDTLASALLASGVEVVGRSFKHHRPRGVLAAGVEEPNALLQLGEGAENEPNPPATTVELHDGLVARAVNCWPSARLDLGAVNGLFGRFIPAGFYYKTFMWPSWRAYEWAIRRAAGLGRVSRRADPDRYDSRWAHCDVLVVGAGPAGLAAARAAAAGGARVMLVEQDSRLGGSLLFEGGEIDGRPGPGWADEIERELRAAPEVTVLERTTAVGYFDHNGLALVQRAAPGARARGAPRQTLWRVRAGQVVLATGAFERPLVFPGNDRPGVMLASAVRAYLGRFGVLAGRRTVLFTNNDSAYATAQAVHRAGGAVVAVLDARRSPPPAVVALCRQLGIELLAGASVRGTWGSPALRHVRARDGEGRRRLISADLLAMSGGWSPAIHLSSQSGAKPRWEPGQAAFLPGEPVQAERSAGAAAGLFTLAEALQSGHAAGAQAAVATGFAQEIAPPRRTDPPGAAEGGGMQPLWRMEGEGKAFVDFQNDVTVDDIELSAREAFVSIEHLKRYTTLGMAVDQGKTSNVNALAIMAEITGAPVSAVGTTRFRPPFTPTALGVFAGAERGELFRPIRRLPAHDAHAALGAVFEEYGGWLRPSRYPRTGEDAHAAEQREALTVRQGVGLFDGSPLGKIEVVGPDAAEFLDRVYLNPMSSLKVGRARYGLMLSEQGVVIDDGVAARLAPDRFWVGTTSGGAARIAAMLEEWLQCEWTGLEVLVAPVTTAWGVVALAGPKAREVLDAAGTDIALGPADFAHMSVRDGTVAGLPARVFRVSYTGEATYEVNVGASDAVTLWDALSRAGEGFGITPVGIDAWDLLRTEKGYLHLGKDTDGTTLPGDVGWALGPERTHDFIGRRSLTLPDSLRPDRPQFVGLELLEGDRALPVGAHMRPPGGTGGSEGYVTSSVFSPTLGRPVALGMVHGGRARRGEVLEVATGGVAGLVRVVAPGVYDPGGVRLRG